MGAGLRCWGVGFKVAGLLGVCKLGSFVVQGLRSRQCLVENGGVNLKIPCRYGFRVAVRFALGTQACHTVFLSCDHHQADRKIVEAIDSSSHSGVDDFLS